MTARRTVPATDLPALRAALSVALVAGHDTAELRAAIANLEAAATADAVAMAHAAQAAAQAATDRRQAAAGALASAARADLSARLAALQPPPAPRRH